MFLRVRSLSPLGGAAVLHYPAVGGFVRVARSRRGGLLLCGIYRAGDTGGPVVPRGGGPGAQPGQLHAAVRQSPVRKGWLGNGTGTEWVVGPAGVSRAEGIALRTVFCGQNSGGCEWHAGVDCKVVVDRERGDSETRRTYEWSSEKWRKERLGGLGGAREVHKNRIRLVENISM